MASTTNLDETLDRRDAPVEAFITRWQESAASERANYQLFLIELCDLLGLARPEPATGQPERDGYVFERPVHFHNPDGTTSPGFIDLYRQGCFVLETKQGCEAKQEATLLEQAGLALGAVAQAAVTDTSPGTVVGQHPDPNSQMPQGTAVDIVVAAAPASPQPGTSTGATQSAPPQAQARSPVPDVAGMTLEDARAALAKAGYSVNRVVIAPGSSPNAKVVRSDPPAGSTPPAAQASVDLTLGGRR